jgi:hypothetical protein
VGSSAFMPSPSSTKPDSPKEEQELSGLNAPARVGFKECWEEYSAECREECLDECVEECREECGEKWWDFTPSSSGVETVLSEVVSVAVSFGFQDLLVAPLGDPIKSPDLPKPVSPHDAYESSGLKLVFFRLKSLALPGRDDLVGSSAFMPSPSSMESFKGAVPVLLSFGLEDFLI